MSTTEKLPKWASLLLTLLIGVMISFGGQLFIARAVTNPAVTKCTLEKGKGGQGTVKFMLSGTVQTAFPDLKTAVNKDKPLHLKCQ
jgi:hypothetical protein